MWVRHCHHSKLSSSIVLEIYYYFKLCVCVSVCAYVNMSADTQRQRHQMPWELELQMVLNHPTRVLGNELGPSGRVTDALNH